MTGPPPQVTERLSGRLPLRLAAQIESGVLRPRRPVSHRAVTARRRKAAAQAAGPALLAITSSKEKP